MPLRAPEKFIDLCFGKSYRKNAAHKTVAIKDIGVARSNDNPKSIIGNGPRGVLAARTAAETRAREQDGRAFVSRPIQDEIRIGLVTRKVAPIVEQDPAISLLGLKLQELLRHHLVGIDVYAV